jgi:hypothetical protein
MSQTERRCLALRVGVEHLARFRVRIRVTDRDRVRVRDRLRVRLRLRVGLEHLQRSLEGGGEYLGKG